MLRRSLDALLESLEATVRVEAWKGPEEIPAPLRESASRLVERLGAADRLASMSLRGSPADEKRVELMSGAVRRLDSVYVAFRQALERAPKDAEAAVGTLRTEIDLVKQDSDTWSLR